MWFDLSWHGSKIVAEHEVPDGEPIAACAHCGGGIYVVAYKSD